MKILKPSIEIMSPSGSFAALHAAIRGGANSIYFGAGRLNMRSNSSHNFTANDIREVVDICQAHGVKSYLTLNTIIYGHELEEMSRMIDLAKEVGVSAVIASDLSVIRYARNQGVEVHISTQCNITNIDAVDFFSDYADVMVTARELNLNQVAEITSEIAARKITGPSGELVKIEIFAHGALCMAVSGKCYISLDNFNSSANRGACLQPCRREYEVKDLDRDISLNIDNKYIMSPKDLKTIHFLNKILDAGVQVLKIEGRGRSPEYVYHVTKVYREAADAYLENDFTEERIKQWDMELSSVYNRGFWDGYYLGRKVGQWTEKYGSQAATIKIYVGKVTNFFSKLNVVELKVETNDLKLDDQILIIGDSTGVYEDSITEIRVDLKKVSSVQKGDLCSIPVKSLIRRGDKLYKVVENPNVKQDLLMQ